MSTGPDGGGGGRRFFLSAHRCPEVDLLPHHDSGTEIPSPCSLVPSVQIPEFTCTGQSDANYLDISNCPEEEEEEREEEGSISDWSEEDLSLHFSPSVILPSGDEDSDPESSFECVDITVIKGQEGEGLKMVPKRQIQLKKKKDVENVINKEKTEKLQVIVKDEPAEARVPNSEMSTDELLHPIIPHRPDVLLRQHSMPASLHSPSTDVNSIRAYKGLVAGACQGVGGNSKQRLQKSFSLDETKTKMASCIIKSVLSKKMKVEQDNSKTSYLHKKPAGLQTADQRRVREGGEDKTGGGVFKAPVHVVRDMRSFIKNTYSLSFSRVPTRTPDNKPTGFKVIGQEESPPPTYQQAVGVKAPHETERRHQSSASSRSSGGHTIKVTTSLSQSRDRKQSNRFSCPITQQRRDSEPLIHRDKVEDAARSAVMLDPPTNSRANHEPSELNQAEGNRGVTHQVGSSVPLSAVIQPPPQPSSTSRHNAVAQPLLCTQEQSSNLGVSSQFAPSSSQQILHSCFYTPTPTALPAFTLTLSHHTGRVSYVQSPMSYIQTQVCPPPPIPTIHLLSRSEESQSRSKGKTSDQPDNFRTTGVQTSDSKASVTPSTQEHHERKHQPQLQQQFHGFLPAHVGSNSLGEDSSAVPGALFGKPALSHVMLDPKCGRCYFMDMPPQPHGKLLLDPETGQYVQVFLPGTSFTPSTSVVPVRCVTPASFTPSVMNATPTILSVMQFQPMVAVSSLYAPPCLPLTIHTPSVNYTHTTP